MERGMQHSKPSISPVVKWIVIGFLGTIALTFASFCFLLVKFSPLLKIDESNDHVSLLGGTIDISGKDGTFRFNGSLTKNGQNSDSFDGSWDPQGKKETFFLKFTNGKIKIEDTSESKVSWHCKNKPSNQITSVTSNPDGTLLDLTSLESADCKISIPKETHMDIKRE